jgi:superfamily II DNA or RNA helicase
MSLLTEREWRTSYRHEDGDLIELFYDPALTCAVQYDRMTGYFSADALALAARGIAALITNDGRMRLIVGCTLQQPEQDAIGEGYDWRARLETHLLAADLTPPDEAASRGLEMLAWMVAQGHLDVKVAVPIDPDGRPAHAPGLYHEKVGILTDGEGTRLSFSGSINETAGGWVNNRESFHVHCGWFGGRESAHLEDEVDAFARLWEGRTRSVKVFDFPEAARMKLLEFLPSDDRFVTPPARRAVQEPVGHKLLADEFRRIVWTFVREAPRLAHGLRVGEMTSAVTPWQHQVRTYTRFLTEWPSRVLIADEVGLGKTISAGLILRQAMLSGLAKRVLILTPKSVQIQWQNELYEKFNLNVPIYDGSALVWRPVHGARSAAQEPTQRPVARDQWQAEPVVLVSSFLMRRAERQRELLDDIPGIGDWDLIILDEAHHARRRGAGSTQEKGPNALLGLMRKLQAKSRSLLLLTATPMQVHPVELWDLMDLLGLPDEWHRDDGVFLSYFQRASGNPAPDDLEYLASLFRSTEAAFGEMADTEAAQILPDASALKRKKVLRALRDVSAIPRRTMDADTRRAAARLLQAASPLRHRMVRNTRELLRRYKLPVPKRDPREVVVEMTPAESALYTAVEDFIGDVYRAASPDKRSAVGFVMTVYRRRLASSFDALKQTLNGRLMRAGFITEEDISQDETSDEVMSAEEVAFLAAEAPENAAINERERINDLLRQIAQLGTDSKARRLKVELDACLADGFDSMIVFTQYTDTMEYLRDYVADQMAGMPVASYSGAGGAWRDASSQWVPCSKEEIKRRLRDRQVRLLVCTDAAAEGLNLQFAGVLVNYDLPWNPMKVEQRIGRIDRLGQPRPVIRVLSFAYKDTVEQDVFFTVGNRINLFQGIVGRLQPILSRLPRRLEELALLDREGREAARQRFLADLEQQVREAEVSGFDIDATVESSLELPPLPDAALTLRDLDHAIQIARARPPEVDFRSLDPGSYGIGLPGGAQIRVTTDPAVFEFSSDNFQLFSPGGDAFGAFCVDVVGGGADGRGIAWMVQRPGAETEFVVATRFGPRTVASFDELLAALDVVGEPCEFPLADWPGVTASVVA